jgi:hypothetical protein
MVLFEIHDDLKMLRETLCLAQNAISNSPYNKFRKMADIQRLERLIQEIDHHRPLGIDGKHGNYHTETCGCEDKGDPSTWDIPPRRKSA